MSHKYVSNKAVMKNEGFLAKLGSTLMSRTNPDPLIETKTQSSITWRKTSEVKARIKTATGTIAIYDDMSPEEIAELEQQATMMAGGSAPELSGVAATAVQTAVLAAGIGQEEQETTTVVTYLVVDDYSPDDSEGLAVVAGQKVILVDKSSPHKRPRLEGDESNTQLLDNSAARHKMAVRPKRNHPHPRSRAQEGSEDRWVVRDADSGKEGLVPSRFLALHSQETSTSLKASLKRSVQQLALEETLVVKKNLMKEIREFKSRKLSSKLLGPSPEDEARGKRTATIRELIETEEEFVKDLEFVMENYFNLMDKQTTPRNIRDHKELIFNNFKFISDFHQNVLIEGVKYHAEVPTMIGRTFLRLERDFDKHAEYCSNEPLAQEFLENNIPVKEYFEEYSQRLGDDKRLQEHLKLPIQRLNDYQLLLRELVKFSSRLGDDTTDLQRAYELMQTIPQRATDAKFISSIEGFKGNLFKLGRLLRHDWFSVKEAGEKARDRYLFLFKARILITKVKRIAEDRSVFILKDIIRLPETSLTSLDKPKALEFFHIESLSHPNYPIFLEARTPEIRDSWLTGIQEYVVDTASVEDLLFDDELRVLSQDIDEEDAGVVSPVPEVQEFEDLPEDYEVSDQIHREFQVPIEREPSPPHKRQKPETQPLEGVQEAEAAKTGPEVSSQQKAAAEAASSPKAANQQAKGLTLEQVEAPEPSVVAEQGQAPTTTTASPPTTPKETQLAEQQDPHGTVDDIWSERDLSPPPKKAKIPSKVEEEQTLQEAQEGSETTAGKAEAEGRQEEEIDIWGSRGSPPLRIRPATQAEDGTPSPPSGEAPDQEPIAESRKNEPEKADFWGPGYESPPLRIRRTVETTEATLSPPGEEQAEEEPRVEAENINTEVSQQEEIYIWGSRDSSPPLRARFEIDNKEATRLSSAEEGTVEELEDEEEQYSDDFWVAKDSPPPIRRIKIEVEEKEERKAEQETGGEETRETYQTDDNDEDLVERWFGAVDTHTRVVVLESLQKQEEEKLWKSKHTTDVTRDETSAAKHQFVEETEQEIFEQFRQEESNVTNIWSSEVSSSSLRPRRQVPFINEEEEKECIITGTEETPIEPSEESSDEALIDRWFGLEETRTQVVYEILTEEKEEQLEHVSDEEHLSPPPKRRKSFRDVQLQEGEEEEDEVADIWGPRDISPPLRRHVIDIEEFTPSPPAEVEIVEEPSDDGTAEVEVAVEEAALVVEEIEEIDIWGSRDSSPPLRRTFAKVEEITLPPAEEDTLEEPIVEAAPVGEEIEEIDIWGSRDSSPPLRRPVAKAEVTPSPPAEEAAVEEPTTEAVLVSEEAEEIDIWGSRDSSPPLRRPVAKVEVTPSPPAEVTPLEELPVQVAPSPPSEEAAVEEPTVEAVLVSEEAEEIDIWGSRDSSPPLRRPVAKVEVTPSPPAEVTPLEELPVQVAPSPPSEEALVEEPTVEAVLVSEEAEEIDIWGSRDSSPPLKRLATKVEVTPPAEGPKGGDTAVAEKVEEINICALGKTSPTLKPVVKLEEASPSPPDTEAEDAGLPSDFWSRNESPPLRPELVLDSAPEPIEDDIAEASKTSDDVFKLFDELAEESKEHLPAGSEDLSGDFWAGMSISPRAESKPSQTPSELAEDVDFWARTGDESPPLRPKAVEVSPAEAAEPAEDVLSPEAASPNRSKTPEEEIGKDKEVQAVSQKLSEQLETTKATPEPAKPVVEPARPTTEPAKKAPEPAKPATSKPEVPKPELPKLVVPKAEAAKPEVKPEVKDKPPRTTKKMEEPTTPFTPGGTPKPMFTKTLRGDVVEPGEGVTFSCEVAHPCPYFVTWLKDAKPLDDKLADRVQQQDSGDRHNLRVMNCRIQDSGIYTAKATDETGTAATCSAQLLVQELTEEERSRRISEKSPFFLVRMKPTEVIENTNLSYTIHVKGDPMPDVQFFKDDKEIKEDARLRLHRDHASGHYELLISHVQRGDEGTYKCLARNKFGRAECQASMTVSDEDLVYESLSGKGSLLAKGEKAEFKWFRDGQEFDPLERFNVMFKDDEDTLALVFQNVTPEDAGLYTCVASTSCGKISCSAELTVEGSINRLLRDPEPPSIKEQLTDTQVAQGGSAMLECKVGGFPKPDLQWTKNGLDVKSGGRFKFLWEDEESVALVIKNVEEKDAGLYRVVAKNELGEAQCSANLAIKAGPKIKSMKKEVACVIGKTLEYHVEVEGEPAPEVRWVKDGKPVVESDRIKFKKESDTLWTLKISSMQMDDCGSYTVVAVNCIGQVSEFFNLQTDAGPQITRGLDPETEKKLSNDLTLEVRATGSPKPDARWFKNGKEIMGDEKFKMVRDESFYMLKIRRLERKDKGTYKCELSNTSGTASTEGELIVRAPPDFITPLKDVCAKEGSKDVKLFVEWEANPKPSVKWFLNDKPIREETAGYTIRGQDTTQVLTINEATPDFVGTYTVKASNEYGEGVCKGRFRLHEAPAITEGLKDVEFLEDSTSKFTFKATGIPLPEIKWTKDGKKWTPDERRVKLKVENEDTFSLVFEEAKPEDSGLYVATVSNVEGSTTTEGSIVVNTPPHIIKSNFRDGKTFIAMHKFLLEVEATAVPEAQATWYCNGKQLSEEEDSIKFTFDGTKYTLERIGCDPEHSGEYKCVLKNKIKEVEEVGQVIVKEKESRVRNKLEDVFVKEFTDATIKCQIVGDPIPEVQWLRNGKPLPISEKYEVSCERMSGWHTLLVKDVQEADKCSFSIKGKNQHGECETSCRMGVLVKPQPGPLEDATVDYGRDLHLVVNIHAFPPPTMVWSLEGKELKHSEHFEYTRDEEKENYGLVIHSAVLEDAGKIAFTASNAAGSSPGSCTVKVHTEKPSVVGALENLDYCLEDNVTFTLRAAGLPLPECHWKKNGVPLKEDSKHVITNPEPGVYCLTINDLKPEDYGEITVAAKSLVGDCSSTSRLTQKKLACEVVEGLENVTQGAEGDDVTLTVRIRASPRPNFVWTKDGDVCEASEKIKIDIKKTSFCEATISLTLVEAGSIDSGQYRLKFSNEVNETSTETALIVRPVRRKPKVTKKPEDVEIMDGKACVLKAKITGFPKPEVKWMKDGHQVYPTDIVDTGVTAEGLYYLEFKVVNQEDAGRYTVVAANEEGAVEVDATLAVTPPPSRPEFLQSLKASKVILGYPVRMEVKLGGSPRPEVQWLKDGQPINIDGKHFKQIVDPDGTVSLQIDSATEGDKGEFTCVAKNAEGDSKSSATLSVLGFKREDGQPDGPARFSEGLKDMSFDEGQTIKLPVAMKGGPVPVMKWYKDGEEIKLGDRAFFTYDGDRKQAFLEVGPAVGSDSGKYKCVIQNAHGSAETECEVGIRKSFEEPCFTSTFPSQAKLPGRDVKMSVKYDGVPLPELTWYFNGKPIVPDGEKFRIRREGDGQTLYLKECTYSDSGKYKVVAKNREGQIEHEAELEVADDVDPNRRAEAPVFLKAIGDQEVFEGSKALFKAIVVGRPEPEFKWFKNGSQVIGSNRVVIEKDVEGLIRLSIRHVTSEDSGVYSLKAWNEHGEASCQGKLICETLTSLKKRPVGDEYQGFDRIRRSGVPMPLPDKPMISALSDRRATISWMPYLGNPPTQPVTYHVEMCESPEGEWITVRTGIRGCGVDITNLLPKSDYKFRVRVANKYGVSEPSPYVMTYRHKLELPPINYEPKMDPNYDFRGDGPYVPEGFRINRDNHGNYYAPPRFLRLDHDTQYGLRGFNAYVKWYAYGYPLPKVRFLRDNKPIDVGGKGRFTYTQETTGEICLYIDRMTEADVGRYECIVTNEHGESRQRIKLALSEYPRVLQPLEEIHIKANSSGRIMCRISGYPPCDVKWFRDWEPITPSFRFRPMYSEPDWYILNINGASTKDAGLYSVAAVNVAGSVHSSCMVHVQEDNTGFYWTGPGMGRQVAINHRRGTLEDHYDVGDEIGRGTQGVVYHCVEHHTGRNFAAKSMWGKDNFKTWMRLEYEMMNLNNSCKQILRLYDAYEGPKNMVLVTHLCGGGDLLGGLTERQYLTEYEVCVIIRQVLLGLDYMHDHCIAHLGLNIGDLLLVRPNGLELKIGDLSLARQIKMNDLQPLDYGMPEFVAPEVANNEGVAFAADMWSVGIITYILLSGTSPFRGENDRETLTKVQKGEMNFDMEAFTHISDEAKDFIAKLLVFKADMRMDVKTALKHPWMDLALNTPRDPYRINTDTLRSYHSKFRDWYGNASCKRWYRRRTLASCFTHPSKMVYPPGEVYTPPESPEREILPAKPEDYEIPHRDYSYELDVIKNESNYQLGPDTYLLQLRDVEFPCRLRSYMKVASARSPSFAMSLRENDYDYAKVPVVHERRRFTDVMDEEIDDERRRTVLDKHTAKFIRGRMETCALDMPRRLKYEIPARLSIRDDPTGLQQEVCFGTPPFLREKPETVAITDGCPLSLTVVVTGDPEPLVQWFKNDIILGDSERVTIENVLGRSTLKYSECHEFDVGLYKVIARNQFGQVTHKFRLVQGHIPGPCDCPGVTEVSDTEALVRWRAPIDDGGSQILCYHLQKKPAGETEWQTIAENIDHEFYLVRGLVPETFYQYRVAAKNFMGWAEFSAASAASRTTPEGVPKLEMSRGMQFLQQLTEKGKTVPPWPEKRDLDYSKEQEPVKLKTGENAQLQVRKYNMMAETSRGRFSLVVKCVRSDDHRQFVAKLLECRERDFAVREEFEVTKFLRHERIVQLYEAYCINNVTVFIMEPLAGVDILTYLAMQYEYSEQHVFLVVTQMLDALSYLHWRGFCHLDLQPDNIVLTTTRRCDVKLVDMGSVQKVSKLGSTVPVNGLLEYIAPEVLTEQQAFPNSDIWSLGAVAYMLLSGTSPFKGEDDQQTKDNIQFVRYRFETLASNTTQEAIRFFMLIFKRDPSKRPTLEECREHRWLTESDFMAKKRERATFFGNRLGEYDLAYHRARVSASTKSSDLLNFNNANLPKAVSYDQEMLCTV